MGNISRKERIFMNMEPFHKYLPNLCFVEIFGLPQKTILPALKRNDYLHVEVDTEDLTYFVRTEPRMYGKRRYPCYNVLFNRLYTRTQKEIIEKTDVEKKLKAKDTKPEGLKKERNTKIAEENDELIWSPLTVGTLIKKRVFQELFNPMEIPLSTMIGYMLSGYALVEIGLYAFTTIVEKIG